MGSGENGIVIILVQPRRMTRQHLILEEHDKRIRELEAENAALRAQLNGNLHSKIQA